MTSWLQSSDSASTTPRSKPNFNATNFRFRTLDDSQQAHTYAAHPEIAALFYLITNGREFRIYRTSHPESPALSWLLHETNEKILIIRNAVGPDAIKKRTQNDYVDPQKPLGPGLNSSATILGGVVTYSEYVAQNPVVANQLNKLAGARAGATGRNIIRTPHGLIRAELELAGPYQVWDTFNKAAGIESYIFESASEFISDEKNAPTIFQNIAHATLKRGTAFPGFAGIGPATIPFGIEMLGYTEAIGYLDGSSFKGTFSIEYTLRLERSALLTPMGRQIGNFIENAGMKTFGEFALMVQSQPAQLDQGAHRLANLSSPGLSQ